MKRWYIPISVAAGFVVAFLIYVLWPRSMLVSLDDVFQPKTLIIDAGHGGEDGGAISVSGMRESELNLSIAHRTENFAALLGIPTKMVRSEDVSVHSDGCQTIAQKKASDLRNRVNLVENTANALLLSIHQNHFSQEKYHGAQVFYAKTSGSEELANIMQKTLREHLDPTNHREAKKTQNVYLMEHVTCTAVLVECGFLSNHSEEEKLKDDTYQKKLAMTMLCGIAEIWNGATGENEV